MRWTNPFLKYDCKRDLLENIEHLIYKWGNVLFENKLTPVRPLALDKEMRTYAVREIFLICSCPCQYVTLSWKIKCMFCYRIYNKSLTSCRLPEIRRTCLANFENVWQRAPRSLGKMSSKEKMNLCSPVIHSLKMSNESLKCPGKNLMFAGHFVQQVTKSFRLLHSAWWRL